MSIGVTKGALQGGVLHSAGCQVLGYLGMAAGTDLVAGSGRIVDLAW